MIVNEGALAYEGVIPTELLHRPYMSRQELAAEMEAGVQFWGYADNGAMLAVMGLQEVLGVTLIRHAYVRGDQQRQGIGSKLLRHLLEVAAGPVLIGTWTAATWAIRFYERHGFRVVGLQDKERLLRRYWTVSSSQTANSVVLANEVAQTTLLL